MCTTLSRVMAMLPHVPRHPRKIDAMTLMCRFDEAGYDISLRSIQRNLNDLSHILPLVSGNGRT
jgi:hypothetical protein